MATKSASLKAFNTHFDEFIEDLINVFPAPTNMSPLVYVSYPVPP